MADTTVKYKRKTLPKLINLLVNAPEYILWKCSGKCTHKYIVHHVLHTFVCDLHFFRNTHANNRSTLPIYAIYVRNLRTCVNCVNWKPFEIDKPSVQNNFCHARQTFQHTCNNALKRVNKTFVRSTEAFTTMQQKRRQNSTTTHRFTFLHIRT